VFSELKPLYQQAGKPAVIESVLLSSLDTLKAGTLPESAGVPAPKPGDAATTLLWTLLFAGKVCKSSLAIVFPYQMLPFECV
jgi:hypothetical protein